MKLKRIAAMLILVCLIIGMLPPAQTHAADITAEGTCGTNLTWTLDSEGTLTISGTGAMENYNYSDRPWSSQRNQIIKVVIEEGATTIGREAFRECWNLREVTIPDGITSIGEWSFECCSSLTDVTIPSSVKSIEWSAFAGCESLTEIVLPYGVTYLGCEAFYYCTGLKKIVIPSSVTNIGDDAFSDCSSLKNVYYGGTADAWANLSNRPSATYVHYNCASADDHWSVATVDATCKSAGYHEYCCPCGYSYQEFFGNPLDHTEVIDEAVPATCTATGKTEGKHCSVCGTVIVAQQTVPTKGHTSGKLQVENDVAPDCDSLGHRDHVVYCTVCGEEISRNTIYVPELGHTEVIDAAVPATCTVAGKTEGKHCSVCNTVIVAQQEVPAKHTEVIDAAVPATCSAAGKTEGKHCSTCNTVLVAQQAIPAKGHTFTDASDNTCDVCGLFVLRGCSGESLGISITTPYDYNHYVEGSGWEKVTMVYTGQSGVIIPGYTRYSKNYRLTFSEPGIYELTAVQYSTGSRLKFGAEISDHDWKLTNTIQATCTQVGHDVYSCTNCGINEHRNITDFASHNWSDATCTTPKTCKVCGATEGSTLPHTEVTDAAVAATCTKAGKTEGKHCSVCGVVIVAQKTVPAKGHTEVIDKAVAATCTKAGKSEGKHCSVCNTVIVAQQEVPALGHNWKDATCYKPKTCSRCKASSGKAAGHIYDDGVDGTCNACGIYRETTEKRTVMHMFRMYDPNSGEHFYTGSEAERDFLVSVGWNYEGVGFTFSRTTGMPVYRLYDPVYGEHLYTMDVAERDMLIAQGWNIEGVAFNSAYDTEVPQYRLHNPNAKRGAYHFTASEAERDMLIALGWEYQGIGFYSSWK